MKLKAKRTSKKQEIKKLAKQEKKNQKQRAKEMERYAIERCKAEALMKFYDCRIESLKRK